MDFKKLYLVEKGNEIGIFTDWETTKRNITGFSGAIFKKYSNIDEIISVVNNSSDDALKEKVDVFISQNNIKVSLNESKKSEPPSKESASYDIYCDGACKGNPGKSGSGVTLLLNNQPKYLYSGDFLENGTNNIAELKAFQRSLELINILNLKDETFKIFSDSQYTINVITTWAKGWKSNNWQKKDKSEIKNLELIKYIYDLYTKSIGFYKIEIHKIKAHAGFFGNELADGLANHAIDENIENFIEVVDPSKIKDLILTANK